MHVIAYFTTCFGWLLNVKAVFIAGGSRDVRHLYCTLHFYLTLLHDVASYVWGACVVALFFGGFGWFFGFVMVGYHLNGSAGLFSLLAEVVFYFFLYLGSLCVVSYPSLGSLGLQVFQVSGSGGVLTRLAIFLRSVVSLLGG